MPKLPFSRNLKTVMDFTYYSKIGLWAENFARNMSAILNGKDVCELPRFDGEPCICVAAGPSLWRHGHLDLLAESGWKHPIFVCDRVLKDCLKRGLIPNLVATVDGDPQVKKFYNGDLVEKHRGNIYAVFSALTVHPEVVETCPLEQYWFVPVVDQPEKVKSLTAFCHFMTKKTMLIPGGHVGFAVWNIALYLGCKPILVGYDLSYADLDIKKSLYYNSLLRMAGGNEERVKKFFKVGYNPDFECHYLLDKIFSAYVEVFRYYLERARVKTVNATEGGSLSNMKNLQCMSLKEVLEKYA